MLENFLFNKHVSAIEKEDNNKKSCKFYANFHGKVDRRIHKFENSPKQSPPTLINLAKNNINNWILTNQNITTLFGFGAIDIVCVCVSVYYWILDCHLFLLQRSASPQTHNQSLVWMLIMACTYWCDFNGLKTKTCSRRHRLKREAIHNGVVMHGAKT